MGWVFWQSREFAGGVRSDTAERAENSVSSTMAVGPFEPPGSSPLNRFGPSQKFVSPTSAPSESASCQKCHAEIVETYSRSGMSRTWRPALQVNDRGRSGEPVSDLQSGYCYRVVVDEQSVWQVESHPDEPSHQLRRRADYLIGSGGHAQAMLAADRGFLTQLPVAWFSEPREWRMNPGFELKNHRFGRPVVPGCVACHTTEAIHSTATPNHFETPIGSGIECRRCHGSSQRHVEFWAAHGDDDPRADAQLAHPGRMTSEQANDLCLQCHLQGDATWQRSSYDPLQFRPGDRLRGQREDFLISSEHSAHRGVGSHGSRMLQSRCYSASRGQLTCLHCHDPHRRASETPREEYDLKCATCHNRAACRRPQAARTSAEQSCVACHMPQRSSREAIHLVFTDHAIPKRKPDSVGVVRELTPLSEQEPIELVSCWPNSVPEDSVLGAAYVLLHESLGPHLRSLRRGHELIAEVLRRDPNNVDARFWFGSAELGLRNASGAIRSFEQVLESAPQHHTARFRLGLAHELAGDPPNAIKVYERLIRDVPNWVEPYSRLAQLELSRGNAQSAANVLLRQIARGDDATAFAQLGLAHRLRGGSDRESLDFIAKSLRQDPRSPRTFVNRGAVHLIAGDTKSARSDFLHALRLDPTNPQALQALQGLAKPN